ncbi:MAG TPA: hypothetical protein VFF66_07710 [Brevundimonas sp.]|nr:hypothetical protein [Brevundimonas sp.]
MSITSGSAGRGSSQAVSAAALAMAARAKKRFIWQLPGSAFSTRGDIERSIAKIVRPVITRGNQSFSKSRDGGELEDFR